MKRLKNFVAEFQKFITRGNVVDMAVGVIVGGAFTAIVNALTNNILRPLINWIIALCLGKTNMAAYTFLKKVYTVDATTNLPTSMLDMSASIYIDWGAFISAIINFLLIAFVLFIIVKAINGASEANKRAKENYLSEKKKYKAVKALVKQGMTKQDAEEKYLADLKAEEEQKKREEEEAKANKAPTTDELLIQIRDILANK